MTQKGVIREIDGNKVMRPSVNHPRQSLWETLREARAKHQTGEDGMVCCGTCWRTYPSAAGLDLHHRHYNNFGNEKLEDVILLCRSCHDSITSRIREERFALGDKTLDFEDAKQIDRFRPSGMKISIVVDAIETTGTERFRP